MTGTDIIGRGGQAHRAAVPEASTEDTPAPDAATGAGAMISHHDRSWPVVTAAFVGCLLTVLSLQQVAEGLGWMSG